MSGLKLKFASNADEIIFLYETRKNPKIDEMLSGEPPLSFKKHKEYILSVQGNSRFIYIAYGKGKEKIGYSQIYDITDNQVEVGFAIHPFHQGKGHGKTLVEDTISKAKEDFPNKKIISHVKENNEKAIHLYEKCGFVKSGKKDDLICMKLD